MFLTRQPEELFPAEDEAVWHGWFEFFGRTREPDQRRERTCGDPAMISTAQEYESAKGELSHLEDSAVRLQQEHPAPSHGLSKAGIRKT